jgi:glycosyltransferase involved in cell wall biosynthesis
LDSSNKHFVSCIFKRGLADCVNLLGQRNDIPKIMNALDVHVLSSSSEGFPNVLAEAMACGTPCVTTDVGDAAEIVGDTGWVVPPKSPQRLAEAIALAMRENVNNTAAAVQRGQACRARIQNNFDIQTMVKNYQQVRSTD